MSVYPRHVAIIMDGNGRWAEQRKLPRIMGHREGANTVTAIVKACVEFHVEYLTLYAFSQENWKRPKNEIRLLMELLEHFLDAEYEKLREADICFTTIGDLTALPENIQKKIRRLVEGTANNQKLHLIIALNYGARQEILEAVKKILDESRGLNNEALMSFEQNLTEKSFEKYLYTAGIPDPDMLIRTSGEMRLSNFLLWQCSYSEIYITKKLWPDFKKEDFVEALKAFAGRERRFGAVAASTAKAS